MTSALVLYESLSGNTSRLAHIISDLLKERGVDVRVEPLRSFLNLKEPEAFTLADQYDKLLVGTYTDDTHQPPELIEELMDTYNFRDYDVAAFGTGDTQWGDRYCLAARAIAREYRSPYPVLKIEQMPAKNDLDTILKWLEAIGCE